MIINLSLISPDPFHLYCDYVCLIVVPGCTFCHVYLNKIKKDASVPSGYSKILKKMLHISPQKNMI